MAMGFSSGVSLAQVEVAPVKMSNGKQQVSHQKWDRLLKRHVNSSGLVDYKGFKTDLALLEAYLNDLAANPPGDDWSTESKMAYYINSYNAYTVKLILDNYPVKSIKDISSPWGRDFIPLGAQKISLDRLENRILRKMSDPRIHFAINCASYSCPPLYNEAFTPEKLEAQLNQVTAAFINGSLNKLDPQKPQLSEIFKWYRRDFKVYDQVDVIGYINQYSKIKLSPDARIGYLDYNWSLNQQN
jgi:hypothetical protein